MKYNIRKKKKKKCTDSIELLGNFGEREKLFGGVLDISILDKEFNGNPWETWNLGGVVNRNGSWD